MTETLKTPASCDETYKAHFFELAHKDRTGRYLRVDHLDEVPLRAHLNTCQVCRRWYDNALRAASPPSGPQLFTG